MPLTLFAPAMTVANHLSLVPGAIGALARAASDGFLVPVFAVTDSADVAAALALALGGFSALSATAVSGHEIR